MIGNPDKIYGLEGTAPKVYNCSSVGESLPPSGSKVIPNASDSF